VSNATPEWQASRLRGEADGCWWPVHSGGLLYAFKAKNFSRRTKLVSMMYTIALYAKFQYRLLNAILLVV
jgi:hypothetical protein